jgi:hypothetical protein
MAHASLNGLLRETDKHALDQSRGAVFVGLNGASGGLEFGSYAG